MSSFPAAPTLIVGIGNPDRGDDSIGLLVARRIRQSCSPLTVIEYGGDGASLIEYWKHQDTVIVIDALHGGGEPGRIVRFEACAAPIPVELFRSSTHAFGLAEGIELARALNQIPSRLTVYGIVGKHFDLGATASPEVEAAAQRVIDMIIGGRYADEKSRWEPLWQ